MKTKIPSNYINSFSEQLRKLLKDNHLTQKQLADSMGVSLNAVNDWINEKSQPSWLVQLFGTMQFLYENVDNFSPIQLFYNGNYPNDPLQAAMEKQFEQNARAKLEQEYKDKLAQEVTKIEIAANKEIQKIKEKYQVFEVDRLREQIKRLEKGLPAISFGREDYNQFKEKLEKREAKLKQEFEEYKEAYNGLSLAELADEEFERLGRAVTYKSKSDGKKRMKNLLKDSDFLRLLFDVMQYLLYNEPELTNEEIGERLCKSLAKIVTMGY